jgi:hypothetical protein
MRGWIAAGLALWMLAPNGGAGAQDIDAGAPACGTPAPSAPNAEACAEAAFRAAQAAASSFATFALAVPPNTSPALATRAVVAAIQAGSARAQQLALGFEPVMPWGRPRWRIAALLEQGQIYEQLVHAIVSVRLSGPPGFGERIRQVMESQLAPVQCLAVVRYLVAVRAARGGALDTPQAQTALRRLAAYDATRIASCATDQQSRDSSFPPFALGDLAPLR